MNCPYCKNQNVTTYYQVNMPHILSACNGDILEKVQTFPFEAQFCPQCLLGFNSSPLTDEQLKEIYDNYFYISPLSGIGTSKYIGMISTLEKYYAKTDRLVEVGCSEGYLLNQLKNRGYSNLLGVEPGPQAETARSLGLNVLQEYFDEHTFNGQEFDGFFLMHVFEHFPNPFAILELMAKHLSSTGKIIIEVPNFDGYHHHHLFFYNIYFWNRLCSDKKLKIIDFIIENNILRIILTHQDNSFYEQKELPDFNQREFSLNLLDRYNGFKNNIKRLKTIINDESLDKIYVWGAGSTGVIYLNQLDADLLAKNKICVVDGSKDKWGNYIPGVNLQVQPFEILKDRSLSLLIIFSEFHNEIKKTMQEFNICADTIEVFV